jgi:hypothetical protein
MDTPWYQCEDCIFGSNSGKQASEHSDRTGHTIREETS